jgi:hypothetical protein
MVGRVNERPPIPLVELVVHYREFKTGRYRTQAARRELAEQAGYADLLAAMFSRSVDAFRPYTNIGEHFIGRTRTERGEIASTDQIVSGPNAAAYLAQMPQPIAIQGLGEYSYVDREVEPARTTAGPEATMANRYDNGDPSTRAISADLLLRSNPDGRPAAGEVKVSTASGDDSDPVLALVQALAAAAQLAGNAQRARLLRCYDSAGFASSGPLDVLVFHIRVGQRPGGKTHHPALVEAAGKLCNRLDRGLLRPHVDRVALIDAVPVLQFTRVTADEGAHAQVLT